MDAIRARLASLVGWIVAAAALVAIMALGSVVMHGFHTVTALTPVIANEVPVPDAPSVVPSKSVLVPFLVLPGGIEVRVGESAGSAAARLGGAEIGHATIDRTPAGERVTRFYERSGSRFVVVYQRSVDDGQLRVSAIYLQ